MSRYDAWLETDRRGSAAFELSWAEWVGDSLATGTPSIWEERFPFEEAHCDLCEESIGGYLDIDLETSADVSRYATIWILPDERAACDDCAFIDEY